jgi:hypothetical protein
MAAPKLSIVLRLAGPMLGRERSALISEFRPSRVWVAGERRRLGATHREPGFNVVLAESDDPDEAMKTAEAVLEKLGERISLLLSEGARGEVDCGLMVHIDSPMASIRLAPALVKRVADRGLELVVRFYSTSD